METVSYAHERSGRHPASWGYRNGEHYRWVLLPGTDVQVMLLTSWMAVDAVLRSRAAPGTQIPLIGHSERYPDFNTLPSGGLHAEIRSIIGPVVGKRDGRLRDTARTLVTKLDLTSEPADLREGYSIPMTVALAASLGFPESEYRDAIMRPTAIEQQLVTSPGGLERVRAALRQLLEYCRDLDRRLQRPGARDLPLARIAAEMRARGMPDETVWHCFRTLATGSVTPAGGVLDALMYTLITVPGLARSFCDTPHLRPGIVSEVMRDVAHFGLMNYRDITEPVTLPDGSVIPAGPAVPSMTAALHDPARFPQPGTFDVRRPVDTAPWGLGEFSCPVFVPSWNLLMIAAEEFTGRYAAYPWVPYLHGRPVISDGLLPGMSSLITGCRDETEKGLAHHRDAARAALAA